MTMNGNLSQQQVNTAPAMNRLGAMPLRPKYDGPAPIKEQTQNGAVQMGKEVKIPKPGFF